MTAPEKSLGTIQHFAQSYDVGVWSYARPIKYLAFLQVGKVDMVDTARKLRKRSVRVWPA